MKQILVKDLQKGDLFYYQDRYYEVIAILITVVRSKCIMSPTVFVKYIGSYTYIRKYSKVILLCRDGEEV